MFDEQALDKFIDAGTAGKNPHDPGDPLAEIAASIMRLNTMRPRIQAKEASRRLFLTRARELQPKPIRTSFRHRLSAAVAAGLALTMLSGGTVFAASGSLPGDPLYPVKRAAESVVLAFKPPGRPRAQARIDLAQTRLAEIKSLIKRGRRERVGALARELNSDLVRLGINMPSLPAQDRRGIKAKIEALTKSTATILRKPKTPLPMVKPLPSRPVRIKSRPSEPRRSLPTPDRPAASRRAPKQGR